MPDYKQALPNSGGGQSQKWWPTPEVTDLIELEKQRKVCVPLIPVSGNNCLFFHLHSSSCYTMSRCPLQFHFRMEVSMDYHPAKEQSGMEEEKKIQGTSNLNKFKDKTQPGYLTGQDRHSKHHWKFFIFILKWSCYIGHCRKTEHKPLTSCSQSNITATAQSKLNCGNKLLLGFGTSALGNLLTLSSMVLSGEIPSYHSYTYTAKGHPP